MDTAIYAVPNALTKIEVDLTAGQARILPGGAVYASLREACKAVSTKSALLKLEAISVSARPGATLEPALVYELRRRGVRKVNICKLSPTAAIVNTTTREVGVPLSLASFREFRNALDELSR